jgi:tRNA(fMet)-specific endonuclease VapC
VSLRFLLDTNILSEPAKPRPNPGVMERLRRHRDEVATAAPVWHELLYGCERLPASARRQTLERYLEEVLAPSLAVLPYDAAAAAWHAAERARLEALGRTHPFVDGQIAAVARTRGLVLITRNRADYAEFPGLVVEDWAK